MKLIPFVVQVLDLILRPAALDYTAASFENRDQNMVPVSIGNNFEGNAFGTILFSFYRDFSFVGILLGSVLYGATLAASFFKSKNNTRARAIFIMLSYGWFTGMMVSPLEQGYFWFAIIVISLPQIRFSKVKL